MAYQVSFPRTSVATSEHWSAFTESLVVIVIEDDASQTMPSASTVASSLNSLAGFAGLYFILGRPPRYTTALGVAELRPNSTRNISVKLLADGRGYEIVLSLTNYDYGQDPLIRVNVQATAVQQSIYRVNPLLPSFGDALCDTGVADAGWYGAGLNPDCTNTDPNNSEVADRSRNAGDIGGEAVDYNGVPLATLRPRVQYDVEVPVRGSYINGSGVVVGDSALIGNTNYFRDELGRRNDSEFLGCACGTLLFTGVTRTRLDGEWGQMTLSFLWDEWKHAEQLPRKPYGTGDVGLLRQSIKCDDTDKDPRGIVHNFSVYWRQPYEVADFSGMFNSDNTTWLNNAGYTIV